MTPSAITVSRPYSAPDSLEKIVGLAPAYYSTRRRMVTKDDHVALVKSYTGMRDAAFNGGICSNQDYFTQADCEANGGTWDNGKVGCCTVGMSYLFEDEHTFINSDEETLVLDYLEQFRMPPGGIIFRDPEVVLVSPTLNITVTTSANTTTIRSSIQTYMTSVTLRLGATFNVADLVDYVSDLDGVTRCYVTQPLSDKKLVFYKYFKLGNLITNFSVATTDLNNFGSTSSDVGYS
ncbi:hypothetical protein GR11A_00127 [Vibrio phage vB_VcorM_GR11A]|nr:hypothetical protein GR11A_00127 [Vibrio phage vB_VcorM_GR11A]